MEALGVLAVAAQDIHALITTRADRACAGDSAHYVRRERASPFQSARENFCLVGYRIINAETSCTT